MRHKLVYKYIGKVLIGYSILLTIPFLVSLLYKEFGLSFLFSGLISLFIGILLNSIRIDNNIMFARDGFRIVTISWILISLIGAIPICSLGNVSIVDGIFEAVSGFTTTGATIFDEVEHLPKCLLFWRDFMHFIGGMGVLAFVMTIVPLSKHDKSMHLLKAEMPGPSVSKLAPSIKKTLYYLYGIYFVLTLSEVIMLLISGMPLFDSILISMGTAGTGGFSPLNTSLATYGMASQIIVTIFMFLFGVNFNIFFLLLIRDFKSIFKSEELKVYTILYLVTVFILVISSLSVFTSIGENLLKAFFNASTFMSSTGFSIGDVNIYPTFARIWVLFMMVVSSCAGSTCGGFKVARLVLTFKIIKRDIQKLIHPNIVKVITFEGKKVEENILDSTKSFMFLYVLLMLLIFFIIGFDNLPYEISINAVFTSFANVGLYFEIPSFNIFSPLSKIVMSIGMLLGRLEIYPIIVLLTSWLKDN